MMRPDDSEALITPEALKAVDRECRDLVMSLRALAALLRDPPDEEQEDEPWVPVLARILDAELAQLASLFGDLTAALRIQTASTGTVRRIDLARLLESASRKTGGRALVQIGEHVPVEAHPEIASQTVTSALSLALRIAEGRVVASARNVRDEGVVVVTLPVAVDGPLWPRLDQRVALLRRIVAAEGGRVSVARGVRCIALTIGYPAASA